MKISFQERITRKVRLKMFVPRFEMQSCDQHAGQLCSEARMASGMHGMHGMVLRRNSIKSLETTVIGRGMKRAEKSLRKMEFVAIAELPQELRIETAMRLIRFC